MIDGRQVAVHASSGFDWMPLRQMADEQFEQSVVELARLPSSPATHARSLRREAKYKSGSQGENQNDRHSMHVVRQSTRQLKVVEAEMGVAQASHYVHEDGVRDYTHCDSLLAPKLEKPPSASSANISYAAIVTHQFGILAGRMTC